MQVDYEDPGQEPRRMNFVTPIEDVSFSPDGYWLAFEGLDNEGNREIYFITDAGRAVLSTNGSQRAVLSSGRPYYATGESEGE